MTVFVFLFFFSCSSLAFPALKQREVCYEDDTLLSFQLWIDDSVPYCSSLLSISDSTIFVGSTRSYTTTIFIVTTTSYGTVETFTVPQVTAFATSSYIMHKRRDDASKIPFVVAPIPIAATATADNPIISKFPSIAQNSSIAAAAYSACSCLPITPNIVTAPPSIQFTRTVNGVDYEALGTTTIATGTTTETDSVYTFEYPSIKLPPFPTIGYPLPGSPSFPASARPFPTLNITTIPTFSVSAGIFPSVNATAIPINSISGRPMPTFNFTANPTLPRSGFLPLPTMNLTSNSTLPRSGLLPVPTANSSANSTLPRSGLFPFPTVNLTTNFNASISGRLHSPILNTTASGRLPLPSVNATGRPLSPVTGFLPLPTFNGTNRTLPMTGSLPLPTGVNFPLSDRLPFQTLNATRPSVRVPFPTLNSTSLLPFLPTGTALPFSVSGQPRLPLNISSLPPSLPTIGDLTATTLATSSVPVSNTSTTTPFLPIGTQISPVGCPTINNTTYTTSAGDQYQLRCSVLYTGHLFPDLDEPDLEGCIEKCSNINTAFSQTDCHGVSFLQYSTGVHCDLLTQAELLNGAGNALAISAVLLTKAVQPVVGAL